MPETTAKESPPRGLINHRHVAALWDVETKTLRRWVEAGKFPMEHSREGTYLFFDRAMVEHRLRTGLWPDGTRFHSSGGAD